MPAGRPPKPTALKILHGDHKINPQRINKREPKPSREITAPAWLSKSARAIWDDIAPEMNEQGVLTRWDVPVFAEWCEALVIVRAARANATREILGQTPAATSPSSSPTNVYLKAVHVVLQISARYGLTPSDRVRLMMPLDATARLGGSADLLSG